MKLSSSRTTMQAFLLLCVIVAASHAAVDTNQQKHYLDLSFSKYDHSPKDGDVMEAEWDVSINRDDLNNDTCVTLQEYLHVHSCPVADQLFKHYDHNNDGCLKTADMSDEFHRIDHDKNNVVSLYEWEQYFLHLTHTLFPNFTPGGGHGPQGR